MLDKTQQEESLDQYFDSEEDFDFTPPKKKVEIKKQKKEGEDEEGEIDKKKVKGEVEEEEEEEQEIDPFDEFENENDDEPSKPDSTKNKKESAGDKKPAKKDGEKKADEESGEEPDDEDEKKEDDIQFYTNLTKELKKKGILSSIEVTDKDEIDEDRFFELQDEELDARLNEEIETIFKGIGADPEATALVKHLKNGGKTRDFIKVYGQPTFKEDLDLTVEKNQKNVITTYLREVEGLDEEELEERMEFLKDTAKKEKYAKRYHNYFVEKEKEAKANLQTTTLRNKQKAIDQAKKFKTDIEEFINNNEEAAGIPIPVKDRKKLIPFMTDASVKTEKGFRTPLQIKIDALYNSDEKLVAFASLLMNDFKLSGVKETGKKEEVKKIREVLERNKDSRRVPSSAHTRSLSNGKTIADLL